MNGDDCGVDGGSDFQIMVKIIMDGLVVVMMMVVCRGGEEYKAAILLTKLILCNVWLDTEGTREGRG